MIWERLQGSCISISWHTALTGVGSEPIDSQRGRRELQAIFLVNSKDFGANRKDDMEAIYKYYKTAVDDLENTRLS